MRQSERLTELSEIFTHSTLGLIALEEVLPAHLIEEAVAEHGREARRKRKLPSKENHAQGALGLATALLHPRRAWRPWSEQARQPFCDGPQPLSIRH